MNFIDFDHMLKREITKTVWDYGFLCECKAWVSVMISNKLADDELIKLKNRKVDSRFPYHFSKAFRRIMNIREQAGNYGKV